MQGSKRVFISAERVAPWAPMATMRVRGGSTFQGVPAVDARRRNLAVRRPGGRIHYISHVANLLGVARCAVVLPGGVTMAFSS